MGYEHNYRNLFIIVEKIARKITNIYENCLFMGVLSALLYRMLLISLKNLVCEEYFSNRSMKILNCIVSVSERQTISINQFMFF